MAAKSKWDSIAPGDEEVFGFLQFDTVGSQRLPGSKAKRAELFSALEAFVTPRMATYGGRRWSYGLDGGLYGFCSDTKPERVYRRLAKAGIDLLESIPTFNQLNGTSIQLRISSTIGTAIFSEDTATILSDEMSAFMKNEREFGGPASFTATTAIWKELDDLQALFDPGKDIKFKERDEEKTTTLYVAKEKKTL